MKAFLDAGVVVGEFYASTVLEDGEEGIVGELVQDTFDIVIGDVFIVAGLFSFETIIGIEEEWVGVDVARTPV